MSLGGHSADEFAERLRTAELEGGSVPLPTHVFDELDWDGARRIARARDRRHESDGDTRLGYKLGWTSAAMREALGIDRPNWGTLWQSHRIDGVLDLDRLRHPKAEPEIVYVAGAALDGDEVTAAEVAEAAEGWALGIEIVHPRFPSYEFTWLDNTADNSSAGAIAVGALSRTSVDPAEIEVAFDDGEEHRSGTGAQAMGSPAEAVAWLVRSLADENEGLRAGEIVFTGGLTAPFDVRAGRRYTLRSPQLGEVTFTASVPA